MKSNKVLTKERFDAHQEWKKDNTKGKQFNLPDDNLKGVSLKSVVTLLRLNYIGLI